MGSAHQTIKKWGWGGDQRHVKKGEIKCMIAEHSTIVLLRTSGSGFRKTFHFSSYSLSVET